MGNCLMSSNAKVARNRTDEEEEEEESRGERRKNGAVRIRVVVTQQELKQLINNSNCINGGGSSSLEELLGALRLRSRSSVSLEGCEEKNGGNGQNWRPDLESIPEDRSLGKTITMASSPPLIVGGGVIN